MSTSGVLLVVGAILFVVLGSIYGLSKQKGAAADSDPMPTATRRFLAIYLLLVGFVLMFLLWRIGTLDFSEAGLKIEPFAVTGSAPLPASSPNANSGTPADTAPAVSRPTLSGLFAQVAAGAVPLVYITASGSEFTTASKLRFNLKEQPTFFVDKTRIQAQLDQSTIDALDPVSVDVVTKDPGTGKEQFSGTMAITVRKTRLPVDLLVGRINLTRELQLLLLALLAGALGSFVHALKSFSDFVGNRTMTASWLWWYITRPFLGAALAVIFYAVLRGGFMAGTQADAKAVSQFGVIAVGALVGMFADKATEKLAEIFDTLFKGSDNRGGKLAAPVIDKLDPAQISQKTPSGSLKVIGDRLSTVTQVKLNNISRAPTNVSEKEVTVPWTATDTATLGKIKVSVAGSNGESATKDLEITP